MQLVEMAVLEIRSRMYGINDEEFQALVDTLSEREQSGFSHLSEETELAQISERPESPAKTVPPARVVVALDQIGRSKRKRTN